MGHVHGLDLMVLCLWYSLAAVAPIGPLAWELPNAMGEALKSRGWRGGGAECFYRNDDVYHVTI